MISLIFLFFSLFPHFHSMDYCDSKDVSPSSTQMSLQSLSSIDPLAICNDGTSGVYYFSPALSANYSDYFVIHLPGGSQCWDELSCNQRWNNSRNYMSSNGLNESCYKTGILDSSEKISPLWGINKVMLAYCSSDAYMGDVGASNDTWGWHMRGQRLVYAMIQHLILNHGLNKNSKILISGGSAGARGVMVLIDELVANHLPKGANVVGFLDSPYYIDIKPFSANFVGFPYQEQQKLKHYNVKKVLSEECKNKYPGDENWKCLFGQFRIPLLKTPYFMVASQYDAYQLYYNVNKFPPYKDNATLDYVNNFGNMTQNLLLGLAAMGKEGISYYSWTCFNHDVSESLGFVYYSVSSGVNQRDALEEYLKSVGFFSPNENLMEELLGLYNDHRNLTRKTKSWIDICVGFECGGCDG